MLCLTPHSLFSVFMKLSKTVIYIGKWQNLPENAFCLVHVHQIHFQYTFFKFSQNNNDMSPVHAYSVHALKLAHLVHCTST